MLSAPAHGSAGIDQKTDRKVLLLFVEFYEEAIEASVSGPVDAAELIARSVIAVVGELETGAGLTAAALGALLATEETFGQEVELLELREKIGIEQRRWIHDLVGVAPLAAGFEFQ